MIFTCLGFDSSTSSDHFSSHKNRIIYHCYIGFALRKLYLHSLDKYPDLKLLSVQGQSVVLPSSAPELFCSITVSIVQMHYLFVHLFLHMSLNSAGFLEVLPKHCKSGCCLRENAFYLPFPTDCLVEYANCI